MPKPLKLMSPTGHLGFTPIEQESFWKGVEQKPDYIIADSGSSDIGPHPLGADESCSPATWQEHDLELKFRASRQLNVPMIVGSASDTGTNRGVDQYADYIKKLARDMGIRELTIAKIYSEVDKQQLLNKMNSQVQVIGLDGRENLTVEQLERTDTIVAVMGAEPIVHALEQGADVVICGRSSDACLFAAPLIKASFPKDIAYYAGKVLECASFCAEPFAGKETVIGTVGGDYIVVEPMSDYQRCTPSSVASHAMYERIDPYREYVPGGYVDMSACVYEAVDERRTRVTGSKFVTSEQYTVKLEGAGKVGERCLMVVGIRDPYVIAHLDEAIAWSRKKVKERFGDTGYDVYYHVYGKNGVMGELEPITDIRSHELGIVVEGVAPTLEVAKELTNLAARNFMYARLKNIRGTAGAAAFLSDEVLVARPGYEWTMNHAIPADPMEWFELKIERITHQQKVGAHS